MDICGYLCEMSTDPSITDPDKTIQQLDVIPESTRWIKFLPWIIDWILIHGGLSALGAAIVLAHPLTILTAFLASPITSLDPLTGVGMFAAFVETYLRKPKVIDFSRLRSDTTSLKG